MFPCISDVAGNEYDLSGLSRVRKPWTAVDTSADGRKRTFYLSVCNPLPYIPGCHSELRAFDSSSVYLPSSYPPPQTNSWLLQAAQWGPAWCQKTTAGTWVWCRSALRLQRTGP